MDLIFNSLFPPTRFTFVVLLLLFYDTAVEGEPQVVGSAQPIVASPGDSVILPCHVEPPVSVARLTVEWSKPDLQPDPNDWLSQVEYVHLHRNGRENLDMKLSSYVARTELFADELRQGNISLKIFNVTLKDEGRYRCFIPRLKSRIRSATVRLVIEPKNITTETPPHPTSLQTPDPKVKGGVPRSRVIPAVVLLIMMFLSVGVTGPLALKFLKQKVTLRLRHTPKCNPPQRSTHPDVHMGLPVSLLLP